MHDVRERIRDSRPDASQVRPVDVAQLVHRARRRDRTTRAVGVIAVTAFVLGGFAVLEAVRPAPPVEVEPIGDSPAGSSSGSDTSDGPAAAEEGEQSPDLATLIDQLIEANENAAAPPTPQEGEVLVRRTYAVWSSTTVEQDGTAETVLEATRYESRTAPDGTTFVIRATLGTVEPADTLAQLRTNAGEYFGEPAGEGSAGERFEAEDPRMHADMALDEAESDSRGSAEPIPGTTERPDQAHAFMRAADALRVGLSPEERIRALEAIGRIDPSLVEYRGTAKDLLGREGVAIAGLDGTWWGATNWTVLIFDPETGDLLGEYTEWLEAPEGEQAPPPISGYTAYETFVTSDDDAGTTGGGTG